MSDITDIKRRIVYSDLPDSEIVELIKILQAKRTDKAVHSEKKSKEETVFLTCCKACCKENRNYNNSKDGDKMFCPHCGSFHTIKNGTNNNGRQKYKCKECGKQFSDTNGTVAFRSKLSADTWIELIKYTLQGESCRTIAKNLGISVPTAFYNRQRIASVIRQLEDNRDDFPSMAEVDEFYYPLSFKDKKDPMFFLEVLGRMPYTHRSIPQKYEYVAKQGFDEVFMDRLEQNDRYRKGELLIYLDNPSELKSQEKFSIAVNQMVQPKVFDVLRTLKEQTKRKVGISNQQVCILTCVDPTHNNYLQPVCVGRIEPKHITKSLVPHFTDDTLLVSDGHSAYKSVANKEGIPLRQIPSNKHESGGYHLGHVNGYHHNLSVFLYRYHGVSTKYLKNYLTLFNWKEKHKNLTYQEQAYEIINLLSKQVNKIPLKKFKDIPQIIDMKGILDHPQMA